MRTDGPPTATPTSVIVVNDNPGFLALVRAALAGDAYRVAVYRAVDGPYRAIRAAPPDLVILDLRTGGELDLHLLTMLKLDPATTGLPILVCSASTPELLALTDRLRGHGCEILPKPFTREQLTAAVGRLTGAPGEAAA